MSGSPTTQSATAGQTEDDEAPIATEAPVAEVAADDGRERSFPCHQCGADLAWKPGAGALTCPYCGHLDEPPASAEAIREYAFNDLLRDEGKARGLDLEVRSVRCPGCGAETDLAGAVAAADCPFCGSMLEDREAHTERIRPEALIPFAIEREAARARFRDWVRSRWFAPNSLMRVTAERFQGVYRSWWTYDSHTFSHWSGQAGYYYYVTRTVMVDGKPRTRRVRKVRWVNRSGTYESFFDDVLVRAFRTGLASEGYRLGDLRPYQNAALAGFVCERYEVDPQEGWTDARSEIERDIRQACSRRLGGDTQRFLRVDTAHHGITFKSVLLPVWHSTYRHREKVYRIAVNGQNGRVSAERPWSWVKIGLAALAAAAVIGLAIWILR